MTTSTEDKPLEAYESAKPMNLEPGIYPATVGNIDEIDGKFGLQWRFEFSINDYPEEAPWAWATAKLGTKTKLYRWATALLGRPLAIGEKLVKAQLIGLPCNVIVKEAPDIERESGVKRYVDDILGVKKAKAKTDTPLPDNCFCGKPVHSYSSTGAPLCEKHTAEAMQE
jgi:hypothetical protein